MPVLNATDLQSLNTQQRQTLQSYTDRAAAAVDVAGTIPVLRRTDLQFFDTEQEEALRKVFALLLPTGYLTWNAAKRAQVGAILQAAFDTDTVRDLQNAFAKYSTYLQSVD
jgi:hypothetical protein